MTLEWEQVIVHATDPVALGQWWAEALGWVRDLRDRAQAGGVAFFHKQWGGPKSTSAGRLLDGIEWSEFPEPRPAPIGAVL